MTNFIRNEGLFLAPYFDRVVTDSTFPVARRLSADTDARIKKLLAIWEGVRDRLVKHEPKPLAHPYVGLPPNLRPVPSTAESVTEQDLVREVLDDVLGFATENNRTLALLGAEASVRRPDVVVFPSKKRRDDAAKRADKTSKAKAASAVDFCREADFALDAKRLAKGVGADDEGFGGERPDREGS